MAEQIGVANGSLMQDAFDICDFSDTEIEKLLEAINWCVQGGDEPNMSDTGITLDTVGGTRVLKYDGKTVDPQSGAGALIIDRIMSELSNLESISANAVATSQRIQKEINSKLS